jgi:hypothetical protein
MQLRENRTARKSRLQVTAGDDGNGAHISGIPDADRTSLPLDGTTGTPGRF